MKQYIRQIYLCCLLLLSMGAGAQEVVGPDGPDSPSTGNKTITVIQAAGGTISPAGDASGKVSVKGGADQAFTVTATKGFEIGSLSVDGVSVDAALVAGKSAYVYTFVGLSADHTLTATFTANRFDLSASAGKGGSIVPAVVQVVKGGSQTFTITPDAGYEIADITVDDVSKGNTSSFILTDIEAPHSIFATFKGIDCRVTWGDIENGSLIVTAEPDQTVAKDDKVPYGSVLKVKTTPGKGYALSSLTVDGVSLDGESFVVKGDVSLNAVFEKATCIVTVETPEGGRLTVKNGETALLPGTHRVGYGTELELANEAAAGYGFKSYKVEPASLLSGSKVTVTENVAVNALFTVNKYKVTITAPEVSDGTLTVNGNGAISGDTEYNYGTVLELGNRAGTDKVFEAYDVTPVSALSGNRLTVREDISLGIRFKDAGSTADAHKVVYPTPLIVRDGNTSVASGREVAGGTMLTLMVANTNTERLVSLTANGNPVEFLTGGGMNTAVWQMTGPVTFMVGMERNMYPIVLVSPQGGTLEATVGGSPVTSGERYPYGAAVSVIATPNEGYALSRILAGTRDITVSRSASLTEDLILSASFDKKDEIGTTPDPGNPDPDAPLGIDLSPQQVVYDREIRSFAVRTLPGGVTDHIKVTYYLNDQVATPRDAGLYDVKLSRPADEHFAAFEQLVKGGLEIGRATPQITGIDCSEDQVAGALASTTATLNGGTAAYLSKPVPGVFAWSNASAAGNKLTVTASGYQDIVFTPADLTNYKPATGKVYLQVAGQPGVSHRVTLTVGEGGEAALYNGDMLCPDGTVFYEGMGLTLKAKLLSGYRFEGFLINGTLYNSNPYMLPVVSDLDVVARFARKADPSSPGSLEVTVKQPVSLVYDGTSKQVAVSSDPVVGGWNVEYHDKDHKAVVPVNAGTYEVVISREEDEMWQACKKTLSMTIGKATPVIEKKPVAAVLAKGAFLEDAALEGGVAKADGFGIVPGSFVWDIPRTQVTDDGSFPVRFIPSDGDNFFVVKDNIGVKMVAMSLPVVLTYSRPSGGTLEVKQADDGRVLPSGSLVESGTKVRIETKADPYFRFEKLLIGGADYTVDALDNQGVVVRDMYISASIEARFIRTSYPPDPDDPDDPVEPDDPDDPDPDRPDIPDIPDVPDPKPTEFTVWVRSTGLGTVTPGTTVVEQGAGLDIAVTPGYSQQLVDLRLNGNSVGAVTEYRLQNIQSNMTIEAVFCNMGIPVYTLTSRTVGKGGFVTPGCVRVAEGSNHQFIIHVGKNGVLDKVETGTEKQLKPVGKPGSYLFRGVKADSLLVATFGVPTGTEVLSPGGKAEMYSAGSCLYVHPFATHSVLYIYRMNGQLVRKQKLSGSTVVTSLEEGIYIASLEENGTVYRLKIRIDR